MKSTIIAWMLESDDISAIGKDDEPFVYISACKTKKWYIDRGCSRNGYVRVKITIETIEPKSGRKGTAEK